MRKLFVECGLAKAVPIEKDQFNDEGNGDFDIDRFLDGDARCYRQSGESFIYKSKALVLDSELTNTITKKSLHMDDRVVLYQLMEDGFKLFYYYNGCRHRLTPYSFLELSASLNSETKSDIENNNVLHARLLQELRDNSDSGVTTYDDVVVLSESTFQAILNAASDKLFNLCLDQQEKSLFKRLLNNPQLASKRLLLLTDKITDNLLLKVIIQHPQCDVHILDKIIDKCDKTSDELDILLTVITQGRCKQFILERIVHKYYPEQPPIAIQTAIMNKVNTSPTNIERLACEGLTNAQEKFVFYLNILNAMDAALAAKKKSWHATGIDQKYSLMQEHRNKFAETMNFDALRNFLATASKARTWYFCIFSGGETDGETRSIQTFYQNLSEDSLRFIKEQFQSLDDNLTRSLQHPSGK